MIKYNIMDWFLWLVARFVFKLLAAVAVFIVLVMVLTGNVKRVDEYFDMLGSWIKERFLK